MLNSLIRYICDEITTIPRPQILKARHLLKKVLSYKTEATSTCTKEHSRYIARFQYFGIQCTLLMSVMCKTEYRGMFETQNSGHKTSSGDIGLNIRTLASPKVGQDQVSGGVSVPCRHATSLQMPYGNLYSVITSNSVKSQVRERCHKLVPCIIELSMVTTKEHLQIQYGTGPGVQSKRPMLACRTRCKINVLWKPLVIR